MPSRKWEMGGADGTIALLTWDGTGGHWSSNAVRQLGLVYCQGRDCFTLQQQADKEVGWDE